jgi:glycogen synthase
MLHAIESKPCGQVIYNGRNPAHYRCGEKKPLVLTAGRLWDPAKNVAAIAEVASRLPWPCYFAGESGESFGGCRMLGKLAPAALAAWYADAAVYALPARYEPFGLSVLEAALSGCALVLGDIASLREIWGDAAIFVRDRDIEGALQELIRNADLRERMSRLAYERAAYFTSERMAAGYRAAYSSVLQRSRACVS